MTVHLALVLTEAELGEVSVHLGAGTLLFVGQVTNGGAAGLAALEVVCALGVRDALLRTVQVRL